MTDIGKELGAQSFTFRAFKDNAKVAELLKECGLSTVELCGVHCDFADESCFDDVIAPYRDSGIEIVSIGVQRFNNDEAAERNYFEFAKRAGCRAMSVNFMPDTMPDCWRTAERLADEYDINLAIHNHGGHHWLGNSQMLRHVFANTSPRIGLCLDTAWTLDSHEDPLKWAEEFKDRLYGVHIKDFVFDRARTPEDVVVGTGNLRLAELLETLKKNGFDGFAVLEYEGDVEDPAPAVKQCVAAVRGAI